MLCSLCKTEKEPTAFCPTERLRNSKRCNQCQASSQSQRYKGLDPAAKEKFLAANSASYHKNKEKYRPRQKAHYAKNLKMFDFWRSKAFAKHRGATVFMSLEEWEEVRKQTQCFWCELILTPPITNVDHVVPICEGGQHTVENVVLACANCNLSREWERKATVAGKQHEHKET